MSKRNPQPSINKGFPELKNKILDFLNENSGRSYNYKQIAKALGIEDDQTKRSIISILDELSFDEKIRQTDHGRYAGKAESSVKEGVLEVTRGGAGYVMIEEWGEEVIINKKDLNRAFDGDRVTVTLKKKSRDGRWEGAVYRILERKQSEFVGLVELSKSYGFLIPDNPRMYVDIFLPPEQLKGIKEGQKVLVKIKEWPSNSPNPIGEVIDILGFAGENETEMHAILAEFGLPYQYPKHVDDYANKLNPTISQEEINKRKDFREILTFTIDPLDAKDFDDALSIQELESKNGKRVWEIGVHIADVSHYVTPGNILDKEALERATSVYLVDRVVPMLPEILSNMICSLRPNEDKFTYSAVFNISEEGKILKEWYGRTIIHSDRRFTYEEAQEIIETGKGDHASEIKTLDMLAKIFRKERMQKGAMELGSKEVRFKLDEKGKPIGVIIKESKDAHKLIEEFMLLANKGVARLIGEADGTKKLLPMVYRIHDQPSEEKLTELNAFINQLGYPFKVNDALSLPKAISKLMEKVEDSTTKEIIQSYTIRSMAKAIYDISNIGHYGLAFDYYTHFTSPIRRYPDLLVHRILTNFLEGKSAKDSFTKSDLEIWCRHSSTMEKKAAEAERASIKYKQVEYMTYHIGEIFDGVVSGVTEWGIYVETKDSFCEGMISIRSLAGDVYYFDKTTFCIRGVNKGEEFRLGTEVKVKVKSADLLRRQIDFELVETGFETRVNRPEISSGKKTKKSGKGNKAPFKGAKIGGKKKRNS